MIALAVDQGHYPAAEFAVAAARVDRNRKVYLLAVAAAAAGSSWSLILQTSHRPAAESGSRSLQTGYSSAVAVVDLSLNLYLRMYLRQSIAVGWSTQKDLRFVQTVMLGQIILHFAVVGFLQYPGPETRKCSTCFDWCSESRRDCCSAAVAGCSGQTQSYPTSVRRSKT